VASGSDHAVPRKRPGLVVAAIRSVVAALRAGAPLSPCPSPISAAGGRCLRSGALPSGGPLSVTRGQLALGLGLAALLGLVLGVLGHSLWRRRRLRRRRVPRGSKPPAHPEPAIAVPSEVGVRPLPIALTMKLGKRRLTRKWELTG
jgi:hypothetical protein